MKKLLIIFEIPLKSTLPEIPPTREKQKQIFIIGARPTSIKFSIIVRKSIIEVLEIAAVVMAPFIMYKALIIGVNVFIVEHNISM